MTKQERTQLQKVNQLTQKAAIERRLYSGSTNIRRCAFYRLITLGYYNTNELLDTWCA